MRAASLHRRRFLQSAGLLAGALTATAAEPEAETRRSSHPRAISGDSVEPDWKERLTLTVGPGKADLVGGDDKVIQAAVDYVARLGGGTVQLLPGQFRLRNAVYLPS